MTLPKTEPKTKFVALAQLKLRMLAVRRTASTRLCSFTGHSSPRPMSRKVFRAALENKQVAVVGARRGIGLEFVKQLLAKGNKVYATARSLKQAQDLQQLDCPQLSLGEVDTTQPDTIQRWVDSLGSQADHLDAVFNIAGAASWHDLDSVDTEELLHLFTTNAVGPLIVVQRLKRAGLLQKGALVANMTSKMGSMGDNTSGGTYAYRASKAAINSITKSMSIDLGSEGITACVLHPGWVRTEMTSHNGLIDVHQCVSGLLSVVETEPNLNGRMFDYKHEEIPW